MLNHRQSAHATNRGDDSFLRISGCIRLEIEHDGVTDRHTGCVGNSVWKFTVQVAFDFIPAQRGEFVAEILESSKSRIGGCHD
jgi:hypothetical protein